MLRYIISSFLFLAVFATGCDGGNGQKNLERNYFDLPAFFENEVNHLTSENPVIEKKISKDEKTETKVLSSIDWKGELAAFIDIDLNKPSWARSFLVDTTFLSPKKYEVLYTAVEDEMAVREVKLLFENNSCSFVQIKKRSENSLFSSFQNLEYSKGEGYKINGYQKVKFAFDTKYEIITDLIIN